MNSFFKKQNGVTLVVVITVVIIMILLSTMLALNVNGLFETDQLNRMYQEIDSLEDAILVYYSNNKELPEKGTYTGSNNEFKTSDNYSSGAVYYIIDANKLDNVTLKFGSRKLC